MEAQTIFLNPFIVSSLCKWKFVICPFIWWRNKRKFLPNYGGSIGDNIDTYSKDRDWGAYKEGEKGE